MTHVSYTALLTCEWASSTVFGTRDNSRIIIYILYIYIFWEWIDEMSWIFACWYKFRKAECLFNNYLVGTLKMAETFQIMRLKNQVHLRNGLMNRADLLNNFWMLIVTQYFLVGSPIYSIYLIFAGCPVALVRNNVLLLVLTWFSKMLLINAWLTVERLLPV